MYNRTMPGNTIMPVLVYDDLEKAAEWLCRVFGFVIRWKAGNHRMQLTYGNCTIAITEKREGRVAPSRDWCLQVRVENVDNHFSHVIQQGGDVLSLPENFMYGERQYSVADIGGHVWVFSQSIADMRPEEWGATSYNPEIFS